jgi:hypothetical protein
VVVSNPSQVRWTTYPLNRAGADDAGSAWQRLTSMTSCHRRTRQSLHRSLGKERRISWCSAFKKSVRTRNTTSLLTLPDLRSSALLVSQGAGRADEWEAAILRGLGDRAVDFEKVSRTGCGIRASLTQDSSL